MPQAGKSTKTKPKGLVVLGSNVAGDGLTLGQTLARALIDLHGKGESLRVTEISRFYRTPAVPEGPDFLNAAVSIETELPAAEVLERLHAVEARFGRTRHTRWAPRRLDLDLIDLAGQVLPDAATQAAWRGLDPDEQIRKAPPELILPHPRVQDRAFVLVPLADIAPDWVHPILGRTTRQMLEVRPEAEKAEISPVFGPWSGISTLVKTFPNP